MAGLRASSLCVIASMARHNCCDKGGRMAKMGYYFNQTACIGYKTCQIALLKIKMTFALGSAVQARCATLEVGISNARVYHHSSTCNHCESPACGGGVS